jgi:ribosome-binding protein aMBF1 (putative translation factor)
MVNNIMASVNIRKPVEFPLPEEEEIFGEDSPSGRVAYNIYIHRCRLGWSQKELADYANAFKLARFSQQKISQIENRQASPKFLEVAAIARAMSCQLAEFDVQ